MLGSVPPDTLCATEKLRSRTSPEIPRNLTNELKTWRCITNVVAPPQLSASTFRQVPQDRRTPTAHHRTMLRHRRHYGPIQQRHSISLERRLVAIQTRS